MCVDYCKELGSHSNHAICLSGGGIYYRGILLASKDFISGWKENVKVTFICDFRRFHYYTIEFFYD
jgi:hypothetical protein